jgi:peroxygenase
MYFDTDNDGEIWVWDTYRGFRDLGFAIPFCLFCSPIIHLAFSYGTRMAKTSWPDPFFRIYVDGIHKAKV